MFEFKAGRNAGSFILKSQFVELKTEISVYEKHQRENVRCFNFARRRKNFWHSFTTCEAASRKSKKKERGSNRKRKRCKTAREICRNRKADLSEIEAKLKALDNPKAKIQFSKGSRARN
jgi:hypothetical protein